MPPKVSVIITAHDRKDYLVDAVSSVLRQEVSRDLFEIIVVKNFPDSHIDTFLRENNVRAFLTDKKSFGAKLAIGIENSEGEILSFLDDDDRFLPSKIQKIIKAFQDEEVVYHHSSIVAIDEQGKQYTKALSRNIPEKTVFMCSQAIGNFGSVLRYKGDWYVSSISVKKRCFDDMLEVINGADTSLDKVLFITSLKCNGSVILDNEVLTEYRIHQSVTTHITDFTTFLDKRRAFYGRHFNVISELSGNIRGINTAEILDIVLIHAKLLMYFFSDEPQYRISSITLLKHMFIGVLKGFHTVSFWSLANLFRKIFPEAARRIYYRRTIKSFRKYGV